MKRTVVIFFLIVLTAASVNAAEPITIGLSLGLTGRHAEVSVLQEKSFRLWERDVNSRGGILGRDVHIIIYDNKSDSETVKSQYEQLISKDRVDLLFAPYSSELTEAILPMTEQYGFPLIASGASGDRLWEKGHRHLFGLYTMASRYTAGFLEMLVQYGYKNIAIIHADDAFSLGIAHGSKQLAESFGLTVGLFSGFKKGTKDFDALVMEVKNAGIETLMVCAYFDEAVDVRLALKKVRWLPKVYYAAVGPALPVYYKKLGADADHTFSSSQWERHSKFPGSEAFYDAFVKAYGKEPSYHAANAYAAGQILEKAIAKVGSLDKKKIRHMLSVMSAATIIGRYGVDKAGRQVKHFPLIIQWQKGKKEIVWPKGLRTAKPIFR